ncbi:Phenazine biosynthesis protein PhzF like [hydrothermal vent metagenome]|uniref:Phenazine biosynthesis protein PhzF like n=1 Tax=hydrothermal vent metagenome TaxID=652676 RepID=A0A3B1C061_9ZZZZ
MNAPTFFVIDAFADKPFTGNPAAVVLLDEFASDDMLQSVAAEMNLSETAFLAQKCDNEFYLRWFTPVTEVALCGHATLASAHFLWETENADFLASIKFHTKSGELVSRLTDKGICLDFPVVRPQPANIPADLIESLGIEKAEAVLRAGPDYLVEVSSEEAVRDIHPDFRRMQGVDTRGVIVTARSGDGDYDFVSRFFAPSAGINEDPATGSTHCALGPYWAPRLGKTAMSARQLSKRGGELEVEVKEERVNLSGCAFTVWRGVLSVFDDS